jgi:S1-C subfamily serine protease
VDPIRLSLLTGGRAGAIARFRSGPVLLGRGPQAGVQLDPEVDLAVSARHAVLEWEEGTWFVQDLGSTNGTLLNGTPLEGRRPLEDGDRIQLGATGPVVRFQRERREAATPGGGEATAGPASDGGPIRLAGVLLLAVALAAAAVLVPLGRERAEVRTLAERLDSVERTSGRVIAGLRERVSGLEAALETSRRELRELGGELARAREAGDEGEAERLTRRLEEATAELERKERAAGVDFDRVERLNRPALAQIHVELGPREVRTATAFAVRPDGLLLTNRHVVDGGGGQPARIAVQFDGSERVWPAEVVARAEDVDLAALRIRGLEGEVPAIAGFHRRLDTLVVGTPVVVLGFPLGGVDGGDTRIRAAVGAGTLRALLQRQLQVDGYGAPGSSGSPVLDPEGWLLGVVRGGQERPDGTVLVVVPSSAALRLVEDVLARERAASGER